MSLQNMTIIVSLLLAFWLTTKQHLRLAFSCAFRSGSYMGRAYPAHVYPVVKPALSSQSDFAVTIATIDRPAVGRLKRHFGIFAALGACGRKHFSWGPVAITTTSISLCLPCLAACGTALGIISVALGGKKLLFLSAESEGNPTIGTLDRFVLKTHWMTSFLKNF
jgi:hypothetical protein